ncbi:hypothetical protein [Lactiplantibacillus plantarum]|uniref:hypothetical protein n=3 Tax=Lactiplantibacillus plantarum TaxID=1590 RepID=UPI0005FB3C53|nr:hypothetical protein [Lactiplantibacillus plantarum]ALG25796.1 hypothetical protein AN634_07025 [Lactiplantibacillus plantarum]QGX69991.1 hypothetical protein GPK32_14300 [Lactiplantibacillus plantarum]UTD40394.1 hypothetical protein H5V40_13045 [Lactiplantibacillus plantarum]
MTTKSVFFKPQNGVGNTEELLMMLIQEWGNKSFATSINQIADENQVKYGDKHSSTTTKIISAADKKEAEQMRTNIVQSDPDSWDSTALAQVPDSVIVAATKKSNDMGGDPGTTANMIAEKYPSIRKSKSDSSSSSDDTDTGNSDDHARAESLRNLLASNQGFSTSVLDSISDSEILEAAKAGTATNADVAAMADTLLSAHPDLK